MKSVLVTGAGGFIGRQCLPILAERGYKIHALVRKVPDLNGLSEIPIEWHQFDLLKQEDSIAALLEETKPTHLLHLAWCTEHGVYWQSLENFHWVSSSLKLLEAFKNSGGKRALLTGTCAEYDWSQGHCNETDTALLSDSVYGKCKNALRSMAESFANQTDLSLAWSRIFLLYGPHEGKSRLIPYVINSLLDGQKALCSSGDQIRDFLHVEDVASALVAVLDSDLRGAINVSSGQGIALKDVVELLGELTGRPDLIALGAKPAAANDVPLLVGNNNRLKEIGWQPQYSLETGLKQTIDWWKRS